MSHIAAVLTDELGNAIGVETDLSSTMIPDSDDERFKLLRFVDPYGSTVFNRLQIPTLLSDLALLEELRSRDDEKALIHSVESLCKTCLEELHVYIKEL